MFCGMPLQMQRSSETLLACSVFQVANNKVVANSIVMVTIASYGGTGNPVLTVVAVESGTFNVRLCNMAGRTTSVSSGTGTNAGDALNAAITFNFATINV